jgi:hypothetical protein
MTQMVGQSLGNPPHATTRRKPIWKTFFLGCLVIHFTQVDDPQDQSCFGVLWFDRGPRALRPAPRLTFFLFRRKESQQRKRRPCREHHLLRDFCCGLAWQHGDQGGAVRRGGRGPSLSGPLKDYPLQFSGSTSVQNLLEPSA